MVQEDKAALKTLAFNPIGKDEDELLALALEIFMDVGAHEKLGIETEKLQSFLLGVKDRMLENPYHNWTHVFDVTQVRLTLSRTRFRLIPKH